MTIEALRHIDEGMLAALTEVGRLFETGEYPVPEMPIAARAMYAGMAVTKPRPTEAHVASIGVGTGTVKGGQHAVGIRPAGKVLEGPGLEVIDRGTVVSSERFVAVAGRLDLIAPSALPTTTAASIEDPVDGLATAGARAIVTMIIGRVTVTEEYARIMGAGGCAPDAGGYPPWQRLRLLAACASAGAEHGPIGV